MARFDVGFDQDDGQTSGTWTSDLLFDLGLKYCSGRDVDIDLVVAHKWFNLAALKGHDAARIYRAEIAEELTRPQIAKAQRLARQWLQAA